MTLDPIQWLTRAPARPEAPSQACAACLCVLGVGVVCVLALRPAADGRFDPVGGAAFAVKSIASGIAAMVLASLAGGTVQAATTAIANLVRTS